jgi:myo-inositol-1-phosphate synthase
MSEVRVAIAGVGNCASALVQGVTYYASEASRDAGGLMHQDFAGYKVGDIKFVASFDVNTSKIGKDLAKAIFAKPNSCVKFARVPELGVKVSAGPILDGVAPHMRRSFRSYEGTKITPANIAEELRASRADILVNYLPVGSAEGSRFYAQACLEAGCAFVNCIPEFIASDSSWAEKFRSAGLPIAGDDIKSQVGATIIHRALVNLLLDRGAKVEETYQLNLGGNTDFENMTVEERLHSKRISKTTAVASLVPYKVPTRIGPSDYVPFLEDKKICYIYLRGRKFGNLPVRVDVKLAVEDSPNSAGVVVDAIRATKVALDRKIAGPLISVSSYCFKYPPVKVPDDQAKVWVEEFIAGKRNN